MSDGEKSQEVLFMGEFRHGFDPKKRLTIPAEWRDQLAPSNKIAVLPGFNLKCLILLPEEDVQRRVRESIQSKSLTHDRSRQLARKLGSMGTRAEWDAQGRVRINDTLLEYAGLTSEVVMVGALDVIELWSPEHWKAECTAEGAPTLGEAAKEIGF